MKEIIKTYVGAGGMHFMLNNNPLVFKTSQRPDVDDYFEQLFIDKKFDDIIEFGTFCGGMDVIFNVIKIKHNLTCLVARKPRRFSARRNCDH